jgi:hypothetical protein
MFSFFLFMSLALSASTADEIEDIKSLYAQTNKEINEGNSKETLFYNAKTGWKMASSPKATKFSDIPEDSMLEQIRVYSHQKHVIKATVFIDTPSGDWANKREYYFYGTGKTAFLFETHFTFLGSDYETQKPLPKGPYIIERRIYFNSNGHEIRRLEKAFTSKTKQPVPVRFLHQIDPVIYTDVNRIPVIDLLSQEK